MAALRDSTVTVPPRDARILEEKFSESRRSFLNRARQLAVRCIVVLGMGYADDELALRQVWVGSANRVEK